MKGVKFEIKGLEETQRMLANLPKELNQRIQQDINRKAANIAKQELEQSAPVSDSTRSKLRVKDAVRVVKGKGKTLFQIGFIKQLYYIIWLVKGTKKRYKDNGQSTGQMQGNDFVTPAHERAVPKIIEYMNENYLKLINRSLKKFIKKLTKK